MASVRSKDTTAEITVRKFLYSQGVRYRKNFKSLPGTPDIVLNKYRIAIFVNGCFWHGHNECKSAKLPKTRTQFWRDKIQNNINRDHNNYQILNDIGWKTIVIWECEINSKQRQEERLSNLIDEINHSQSNPLK